MHTPILAQIFSDLRQQAWAVQDGLLPDDCLLSLRQMALQQYQSQQMTKARVGQGAKKLQRESIRGDEIAWIENWQQDPALQLYKDFLLEMAVAAGPELFLSLKSLEAHFAVYPTGSFYRAHVDQHPRTRHRQISCILYLGDWQPGDGGELMLYPQGNASICIKPKANRFLCFLSKDLVHEVLLVNKLRLSLTGWLRDDG